MNRITSPVTIQLSEAELSRMSKVITDYDFRWQVGMADAAQRASDDLAIMLPILQKLIDAKENS